MRAFLNKRVFGLFSWRVRRRRIHRPEVLGALLDDLKRQSPDHVAITGDLTNVALEQEFLAAASCLARLGSPDWITLVPGNHDAYVAVEASRSWDRWAEFMRSDAASDPTRRAAPTAEDFPMLRVRGEVALVGLCSAQPTGLFQASGTIGSAQLARLGERLRELRGRGLCRVVLVHHPPTDEGLPRRRRLLDSAELRAVLAREGAELVIHGHRHRTALGQLQGPEGPIPVAGVRSASDIGESEHKRAQYHLYRIERAHGSRFRLSLSIRGYDVARGDVVDEGERVL
jgi:3',5'-cyclic AMP phosphodiesterase CpdA